MFHFFSHIFSLKDLCVHPYVKGSETLKKTCYLVQGAMMHEYCRQKSKTCLENRALVSNPWLISYVCHCQSSACTHKIASTLDTICNQVSSLSRKYEMVVKRVARALPGIQEEYTKQT